MKNLLAVLLTVVASLVISITTIHAADFTQRQKLILRVSEEFALKAKIMLESDKNLTNIEWAVSHKSDFGPVEIVDVGGNIMIVAIGQELKGVVVFIEFFGPKVPGAILKVDEKGVLQVEGKTMLPKNELEKVSSMAKSVLDQTLKHFNILSDQELESFIKKKNF